MAESVAGPAAEPLAVRWRRAGPDDAVVLLDLERAANLVGLAHVFGDHPFPDGDVLARWVLLLDRPDLVAEVAEEDGRPVALAAHDDASVRHVAVAPDHWGRGLGRAAVERALAGVAERPATLWCLAENHRARALYARLGWRPTGVERGCPWPPFPREIELAHD